MRHLDRILAVSFLKACKKLFADRCSHRHRKLLHALFGLTVDHHRVIAVIGAYSFCNIVLLSLICRNIREFDPDAKVILITAAGQLEKQQEAEDAGAACFITKPYNNQEILDAISKCIEE